MNFIALFFAGLFLCNSVPHLVCGLQGAPFPSPFAKPHGVGDSSPLVNFYWGFANALIGTILLTRNPVTVGANAEFIALLAGILVIGTFAALHFGKVQGEKRKVAKGV